VKIAVLGAYQTKFGELWDKSLGDLIFEAGSGAIRDAQINKKKIQIAFIGNKLAGKLSDQNHLGALLAENLGINIPVVRIEAACASGGVAVAQSCMAIESGQFDYALVIGAEKMTDRLIDQVSSGLMSAAGNDEQQGGFSFVGLYALIARKYLQDFSASEKDLTLPAAKNHWHASFNPKAQFPFPVTVKQILASAVVADPLRLLECSPVSDGAAALVLANPRVASKNKTKNRVYITASSQASTSLSLSQRKSLTQINSSKLASQKAYQQAGLGPKDLSLLEVHDCFSIAEIIALEDLGIYQKGEGFIAERNGEVRLGGKRPVNLSGGLKACGHPVGATGVKQVVEIVDQLRDRAGKRQAKGLKVGLTHNLGGTGGTAVVHILQK